ncbi:MAG TPA: hypothetical protein VNJ01_09360 [Bacteriovoracaceae bacterium]|nr:hypothetical protein [Bacteriovoracaceae bacterium]
MLLRTLLTLFLITSSVYAETLQVTYGLKSYTLTYEESLVVFEGELMKLSLQKKSCNQGILKKFLVLLRANKAKIVRLAVKPEDSVRVTSAGESFYTTASTPGGRFLQLIPGEIKRMKIEEKLRCKVDE